MATKKSTAGAKPAQSPEKAKALILQAMSLLQKDRPATELQKKRPLTVTLTEDRLHHAYGYITDANNICAALRELAQDFELFEDNSGVAATVVEHLAARAAHLLDACSHALNGVPVGTVPNELAEELERRGRGLPEEEPGTAEAA